MNPDATVLDSPQTEKKKTSGLVLGLPTHLHPLTIKLQITKCQIPQLLTRCLHLSNKDVDGGDEVGITNMMLREEHEGNHNEPQTSHLKSPKGWLWLCQNPGIPKRTWKLDGFKLYILYEIKLNSQSLQKSLVSWQLHLIRCFMVFMPTLSHSCISGPHALHRSPKPPP